MKDSKDELDHTHSPVKGNVSVYITGYVEMRGAHTHSPVKRDVAVQITGYVERKLYFTGTSLYRI